MKAGVWCVVTAQSNNAAVMFLCGADVLQSFAVPGVWRPEHVMFAIQFSAVCNSDESHVSYGTIHSLNHTIECTGDHVTCFNFFAPSLYDYLSNNEAQLLLIVVLFLYEQYSFCV